MTICIYIILEHIQTHETSSYSELKKWFQQLILSHLYEIKNNTKYISPETIKTILKTEKRISNWQKSEVYLEHLLMPRLNWLYDLGIIIMNDKLEISFTNSGINFFEHLSFWNDTTFSFVFDPALYIDQFFMKVFDDVFNNGSGIKKTTQLRKIELNEYLVPKIIDDCFNYFRTLAPNRITASQAIQYVKYAIYIEHSYVVDFQYIQDLLQNRKLPLLIYKTQDKFGDGYIQKKGV